MYESPRPEDLGEQRTRVDAQAEVSTSAPDPRSEPGPAGVAGRFPVWVIVGGVVVIVLIALYLAFLLTG